MQSRKNLINIINSNNYKIDRIKEWHKGFSSGTTEPLFHEYIVLSEMHWSWDDLYNIPEREYLGIQKILQIKGIKQNKNINEVNNKKVK